MGHYHLEAAGRFGVIGPLVSGSMAHAAWIQRGWVPADEPELVRHAWMVSKTDRNPSEGTTVWEQLRSVTGLH